MLPSPNSLRVLLLGGCVVAGCASNVRSIELRRDLVGSKYAKQSGYFAACGSMCAYEETPGQIRHDVILDEAVLAGSTATETCVDVTLRTRSSLDEPVDQLSPMLVIDGKAMRGFIEVELVSVKDFTYGSSQEVMRAERVSAHSFSSLSIEQPATMVFRVVERATRICAPGVVQNSVQLQLRNANLDYGASAGRLEFAWRLTS